MIAHLLQSLRSAVARGDSPGDLERHLDGIAAIMESHFRYEERQLLTLLDEVQLAGPVAAVLGPI